jgi:hypothetical protein
MNSHTIIYLDQNYLSNMAKAQIKSIKDKGQAQFWYLLFNDLKKAALTDKVACPESEFHLIEAKYDERLREPIKQIIKTLSGGLQLRPWKSILESQVKDSARQFLGKKPEERENWSIAFMSDPHSKYIDRVKDIQSGELREYVHPILTSDDIDHDRQLKLGFSEQANIMLEEYSRKPLGWAELLLESKKSVIDGFMGKYAEQSIYAKLDGSYPLEDKLIATLNYIRLKNFWDCIHLIGINPKDYDSVNKFARSTALLDSPFIDINASIQAAIAELYLQGRKPQKGDFYDVPILSVVLPYCNVATTDNFMKEILIKRLHFDDKYNVKIFSASQKDRMAFQKLIRKLLIDT